MFRILPPLLITACTATLTVAQTPNNHDAVQLWQQHSRISRQQEQESRVDEQTIDAPATENELNFDGQSVIIEHNAEAVGQALFFALNRQLWTEAEKLLMHYQTFKAHHPELVLFAEATLARQKGDMETAEQRYRQLLQADPSFIRAQLDLARVLFENKKSRESTALFNQLARLPLPDSVRYNIDDYRQALAQRQKWQLAFSLGYQYATNINQSSERSFCTLNQGDHCFARFTSPPAADAQGWRYEVSAQKQTALSGHHGMYFYLNSYGHFYPHAGEYAEDSSKVYFGYRYQNMKTELTLTPLFEYNRLGNRTYSRAWGVQGTLNRRIGTQHWLNVQMEQKRLQYSPHYNALHMADLSALYTTLYYTVAEQTTLFGGLDGQYRRTADKADDYYLYGLRAGINRQFGFGLDATLLALLRRYDYRGFNGALNQTRRDNQQVYLVILKMPTWQFYGMTPSLWLKHSDNRSNVDWLYSYKQNEIQLNVEWQF
ncbi:surface lipoprotein assembly modifier [Necropsobacter massiliensis]|uniref:surface lipoprotein assembly modifier n=1 Tax=Necropsobacter massiliensis TaxID=1400001 RepID=UPI0006618789|nr:surface lipoprotein assembly modifier [Necropsobacter massiliensis]